jgi:Tol biopolymer transport system component
MGSRELMLRGFVNSGLGLLIVFGCIIALLLQMPQNGDKLSFWMRDSQDARQVWWDLRTGIVAIGEVRPLLGVLSPDGQTVITAAYRSGEMFLYRSSPDSLDRTLIGQYDYDPTVAEIIWTADGSAIVLVDTYTSLVTRIIRIDIDSGVATVIAELDFVTRQAQWSPDGRYVLLRNDFFHPIEVRIVYLDTESTTVLPFLSEAHLSPDGQYLVYQRELELQKFHILHLDSGATQSYTLPNANTIATNALGSIWSLDSQSIAFGHNDALYQFDVTTQTMTLLADIAAQIQSWSPDKQTLLLISREQGQFAIYYPFAALYQVTTHQLLQLDSTLVLGSVRVSWSQDSTQLVLSHISSNNITIYVLDTLTGAVLNQLNYSTEQYRPVYFNDGTAVNWSVSPDR